MSAVAREADDDYDRINDWKKKEIGGNNKSRVTCLISLEERRNWSDLKWAARSFWFDILTLKLKERDFQRKVAKNERTVFGNNIPERNYCFYALTTLKVWEYFVFKEI